MEDEERYEPMAADLAAIQGPPRPNPHIWVQRLRRSLARNGVKEQDWESFNEPVDGCCNL